MGFHGSVSDVDGIVLSAEFLVLFSLVFMSLALDEFGDFAAVIGAVIVFADIAALAFKLS